MHRLTFLMTIALGVVACGDDTGGSGGSAGTGGAAGTGGDAATTTATTTGSGDGGAGSTTTATTTSGGGGGDFQSLIDACEALDTALAPFSAELACATPVADTDCTEVPATYAGCEEEAEAWFDCYATEATIDDCECDGDDRTVCSSPAACQTEYDAFTLCAF
jgi:hypothetical protein